MRKSPAATLLRIFKLPCAQAGQLFLSAHRRGEIKVILLRVRLRRSVRCEIFPPWEAVAKCPVRFIERGESPDDIAVDQRTQNRPPLHALEVPEPKGKKAHRHADKTAHAVIPGFEPVDVCAKMGGDLLHK